MAYQVCSVLRDELTGVRKIDEDRTGFNDRMDEWIEGIIQGVKVAVKGEKSEGVTEGLNGGMTYAGVVGGGWMEADGRKRHVKPVKIRRRPIVEVEEEVRVMIKPPEKQV